MGPFPKSKSVYRYVLAFQDLFMKWIEIVSIRAANGTTIRKNFMNLIVSRWGTQEVLHTDNGTEFCNKMIRQICTELGILQTTSPLHHAQANPTKRVNRILKTMIVTFLYQNHRNWDAHLPDFRYPFNKAIHSALRVLRRS